MWQCRPDSQETMLGPENIGSAALPLPFGRTRNDGRRTVRVDVEYQEGERRIGGIAPLMDEAEWLVDQRSGRSLLGLAIDRVGARARQDLVESRARPIVRLVRVHLRRKRYPRQIEIINAGLQIGNRCRRPI